jgi:2-polyprenyl-3-methyl-5-hydroxy-6-metoxy-1,4-benzoquinol methylase
VLESSAAGAGTFSVLFTKSFDHLRYSINTSRYPRIAAVIPLSECSPTFNIEKRISPGAPDCCGGSNYEGKSKLAVLLGEEIYGKIAGKVIVDFGCGEGDDAIEMAERGARRVIGIDIREDVLQKAKEKAA